MPHWVLRCAWLPEFWASRTCFPWRINLCLQSRQGGEPGGGWEPEGSPGSVRMGLVGAVVGTAFWLLSLDLVPACAHTDLLSDPADSNPVLLCSTDSHCSYVGMPLCACAKARARAGMHGQRPVPVPGCVDRGPSVLRVRTCARIFVCCRLLLNTLCPWGWCLLNFVIVILVECWEGKEMNTCRQFVMINLKFICTLNGEKTPTFKIYLQPLDEFLTSESREAVMGPSLCLIPTFSQDVEKFREQYQILKRKLFLEGCSVTEIFGMLQGYGSGKRRPWNQIFMIYFWYV